MEAHNPVPASWANVQTLVVWETGFYLGFGLAFIIALVILEAVALLPLARSRGRSWYGRTVGNSMLLFAVALVVGIPANAIFVGGLRYRYYVPGDPIVDWLPFIPSGEWVVDTAMGGRFINGGSAQLLAAAWLVLAVPVWLVAWRLYRPLLTIFMSEALPAEVSRAG